MSDTVIRIGYGYNANTAQRNAALGFNADPPPTRRAVEALVDAINDSGGIAGRKLEAFPHEFDATSTEPFDQQAQAACTAWTQDYKVYAVVNGPAMRHILRACLQRHRTLGITAPVATTVGSAGFRAHPLYYEPTGINLDSLGVLLARGLHSLGYYRPIDARPMKVALLRADDPEFARAAVHFKRTLAALGVKLADETAIVASQSTGDAGRASADLQSTILRFRSMGITHVVIMIPDPGGTVFFIRFAQGQNAQFRYGLSSNDAPQVVSQQPDVQDSQLRGALAVGWSPVSDVAADRHEPITPARRSCEALLRARGVVWTDRASLVQTLEICDYLMFLRAVLGSARIPIDLTTFADRAARLGDTFGSAVTFGTRFSPGRRWGGDRWRGAAFLEACSCFRYTRPAATVPVP